MTILLLTPILGPFGGDQLVVALSALRSEHGITISFTLHELCRMMALAGKPEGIDGAEVEKYFREGRIREIAEYCESDVVNTYRVWLRHGLFQGKLTNAAFEASEGCLQEFIKARSDIKPHLCSIVS
jgi:3'-5' exonuclease